jgi:hypothetical protein
VAPPQEAEAVPLGERRREAQDGRTLTPDLYRAACELGFALEVRLAVPGDLAV